MSSVQDILNVPSEWPASFPQPAAATRVLTYVFEEKDSSKVEEFLKFLKEKFPKAKVSVVKDELGFSSVSITQLGGEKSVEEPVPVPVEEEEEVVEVEVEETLDASAAAIYDSVEGEEELLEEFVDVVEEVEEVVETFE